MFGVKRLVFALVLFVVPTSAARGAEPRWLKLVATTDRHGHVETEHEELALDDGRRVPVERGGVALLSGYLANLRKQSPGGVVLLDGGDLFQGTMVSNLGEGAAVVAAMNALGYDASALGNHEFDFGPVGPHATAQAGEDPRGALRARAKEARFPIVSANIVEDDGKPLFQPYAMVRAGGVSIAIVGGTSEDLPRTTIRPNLVGLKVLPLAPAIARAAREARLAGAKVVVVVVHAGGECAVRRAALTDEVPGDLAGCERDSELFRLARELKARADSGEGGRVDALFGGHTHKSLTAVVAGIPVAQAWPSGMALAEIDLALDASGAPTGKFRVAPILELCSATLGGTCEPHHARGAAVEPARFAGAPVEADPKLTAVIAPAVERARAARAAPVNVRLDGPLKRRYAEESPLGNLVADLVREATHADVGLVNGGGLRADLPAGALTYGALFETLPFDNKLATVRLDGAALLGLITRNLQTARGVLSISGARVEARCQGGKLEVAITLADGRRVEESGKYLIGTSDFLALGGDDFSELGRALAAGAITIDDEAVLRDVVAARLAALGPVLRSDDARWFDPAKRRLELPHGRPVHCAPGER
jgi:5'-nucleotidase